MRKFIKLCLFILQSILIFIVIGAVSTALVKNVYRAARINEFKSRGVYQEDISTDTVKMYKVDGNEELPTYKKVGDLILPGAKADIITTREAVVGNGSVFAPFINGFVSFFAGGHAALVLDDYGDFEVSSNNIQTLEATGLGTGDCPAKVYQESILFNSTSCYNELLCFRANISNEQRDEVLSLALSYVGDPYNFSFLFDTTNKSYCSDLVSKVYRNVGIDLNKDNFTTSVYDIEVSSDVYLAYYQNTYNGIKYIYYLGWEE